MTSRVGLSINWRDWHNPPFQECYFLVITPGVSTVKNLLDEAASCSPPIIYTFVSGVTGIDGVEDNQDGNGNLWVCFVNGKVIPDGFADYTLYSGDNVILVYTHFSS